MSIVFHDTWTTQKGTRDARRHQEKVDDAIRKNIKNVIGDESIITREGKKTILVPIKGLKDYRFTYKHHGHVGGVGQGEYEPGDILNPGEEEESAAGNQHGPEYMETEVDLDYLLKIMFEDLGLPWLDETNKTYIEIRKGWKFENISKKGVYSRIHKKRTMIESIKRNMALCGEIIRQTNCSQEEANLALAQTKGDINQAIDILLNGILIIDNEQSIIIQEDDLRFKHMEEDIDICSNAVVFALMDVSGSMTPQKKYLCRSLLFWLVEFLKKEYQNVHIRFIQHADEAKEVDEDTFFKRSTYGGTLSYTAFEKANNIINAEYPLKEWNIYTVYCSDGDDFDSIKTISQVEDMLPKLNMISYIEVREEQDIHFGSNTLLRYFREKWKFIESKDTKEGQYFINEENHFIMSVMKDKSHVWETLKYMLNINGSRILNETPTGDNK
jgi:hypothetical protein